MTTNPVELNTAPRKSATIVLLRAREFDLLDYPRTSPIRERIRLIPDREPCLGRWRRPDRVRNCAEMIDDLNDDEVVDLIALAWVGRAISSAARSGRKLDSAREATQRNRWSGYLMGMPTLSEFSRGPGHFGHPTSDEDGTEATLTLVVLLHFLEEGPWQDKQTSFWSRKTRPRRHPRLTPVWRLPEPCAEPGVDRVTSATSALPAAIGHANHQLNPAPSRPRLVFAVDAPPPPSPPGPPHSRSPLAGQVSAGRVGRRPRRPLRLSRAYLQPSPRSAPHAADPARPSRPV